MQADGLGLDWTGPIVSVSPVGQGKPFCRRRDKET